MPDLRLALRIQHHPSRSRLIEPLLESLSAFTDVAVVPDPEPDGKPNAWRAHHACLKALPDEATHLFVLQDDARILDGFHIKTLAALEQRPESVLLAFVPGFPDKVRQMGMARSTGASFLQFHAGAYVPTVAIIYPREVVSGLLDWTDRPHDDRRQRPMRGADDGILAAYCSLRRLVPLALVPSIVEHDDSIVSVMGKRMRTGRQRRAALL